MATDKQLQNWFKSLNTFKHLDKGILGQYDNLFKALNSPLMLKSMNQLRDNLSGLSAISQIALSINKSTLFPFNSHLSELQQALKNISLPLNSFTKIALEFENMSKEWRDQYLGAAGPLLKTQYDFALKFSKISELTLASTSIYKQLSGSQYASMVESTKIRQHLLANQLKFSSSFSMLFNHYDKKSLPLYTLPSSQTIMPAAEYYNSALLSKSFSYHENSIEYSNEEKLLFNEIKKENTESLDELLGNINNNYLTLLNGARDALKSKNNDRIRHFSVSLRELFTHILHYISPDSEIMKWSKESKYYEKGKPTRTARLEYLYSSISEKPFKKFVELDIKSTNEFLNLFHEGTHSLIASFTELQLKTMLQRMESLLHFILTIKYG